MTTRRVVGALVLAAAVTATAAAQGEFPWDAINPGRQDAYAIGLWGDLPYSTLQATVGVPNLIADMNSQDLAFTVHDGDLKAGSRLEHATRATTRCTRRRSATSTR